MTTPTQAQARALAEEARERHKPTMLVHPICHPTTGAPCDASRLASALEASLEREEASEKHANEGWFEVAACHRQLGEYVEAVALAEEKAEASLAREEGLRGILEIEQDDEREDDICARCGDRYMTRPGADPSPECDPCAQAILYSAREALASTGGRE
jgi:hypothetical protein